MDVPNKATLRVGSVREGSHTLCVFLLLVATYSELIVGHFIHRCSQKLILPRLHGDAAAAALQVVRLLYSNGWVLQTNSYMQAELTNEALGKSRKEQ